MPVAYPEIHYNENSDVFVINDISLSIPPEYIQIQKEDLQYQWKVLRSRVSTKYNSRHGQNVVHVRIPYKYSDAVELHRLITELSNSPYCSVENLLLRESFVPNWNYSQKMAFSLVDFALSPYPGSSDTFVVELKFVWFNYFPYMHNWLYRKEWSTEWLSYGAKSIKKTIGWNINEYGERSGHRWDNIVDQSTEENLTDEDIVESKLFGTLYDLLPLPDRMEPADFTYNARDSLIYKRYINFLQRDRLKKHFGIDVEADLALYPKLKDLFFSAHVDKAGNNTVKQLSESIYDETLDLSNQERDYFNSIQRSWVDRMLEFNSLFTLGFEIYKTVTIPTGLKEQYRSVVAGDTANFLETTAGGWLPDPRSTTKFGYRKALANPAGFHSPFGDPNGVPYRFQDIPISSKYRWRSNSRYNHDKEGFYVHKGMDIGFRDVVGETFFAVKDGLVQSVVDYTVLEHGQWVRIRLNGNKEETKSKLSAEDKRDLEQTLQVFYKAKAGFAFGGEFVGGNGISLAAQSDDFVQDLLAIGAVVPSISDKDTLYLLDAGNAAGRSLVIKHDDGSIAKYFHYETLEPDVRVGNRVSAGQLLGKIGNASTVEVENAFQLLQNNSLFNNLGILSIDNLLNKNNHTTDVVEHLHFEYWEPINTNTHLNPKKTGNWVAYYGDIEGYIATDWTYLSSGEYKHMSQLPDSLTILKDYAEDHKEEEASNGVKNEDILAMLKTVEELLRDGWYYYTDAADVINVWYKPIFYNISAINNQLLDYDDVLLKTDLVYTKFVAGFSNILSSLPILDHEFPTHQFLGSTEPFYNFDFVALDGRMPADGNTFMFEGIGDGAAALEMIRQTLTENSSRYRRIPNSWTCRVDTFATRLLGTSGFADVRVDQEEDEILSFNFKKRTSISRMNTSTVQGSPGTVNISLECSETNTYDQEIIATDARSKEDLEKDLSKVLNALYSLKFDLDDKAIAALAIASFLGEDVNFLYDNFLSIGSINDDGYIEITKSSLDDGDRINEIATLASQSSQIKYSKDTTVAGFVPFALGSIIVEEEKLLIPYDEEIYNQLADGTVILDFQSLRDSLSDTEIARLAELDLDLLLLLHEMVMRVVLSANLTLAEDSSKLIRGQIKGDTLSRDEVRESLYALPVEPRLLRTLQEYYKDVAIHSYWPSINLAGVNPYSAWEPFNVQTSQEEYSIDIRHEIESNSNYLTFEGLDDQGIDHLVELGFATNLFSTANQRSLNLGFSNLANVLIDLSGTPFDYAMNAPHIEILELFDNDPSNNVMRSSYAKTLEDRSRDTFERIAKDYMLTMPMWHDKLLDYFVGIGTERVRSIIGPIFDLFSEESTVYSTTTSTIITSLESSGYIVGHPFSGALSFYVAPENTSIDGLGIFTVPYELDNYEQGSVAEFLTGILPSDSLNAILRSIYETSTKGQGVPLYESLQAATGINPSGSPFVWEIERSFELDKVTFYKQALARIGQEVLKNPAILRFLGLADLSYTETDKSKKGREAYPDLELPSHPFFGDTYSTYPDFYMWNMYEDGQFFNDEVRNTIVQGMHASLTNAYYSIKKIESGDTGKRTDHGDLEEQKWDESEKMQPLLQAEGSDIGPVGPMDSPFYPVPEAQDGVGIWLEANQALRDKAKDITLSRLQGSEIPRVSPNTPAGKALSVKPSSLRMSNTEGMLGDGGGIMYPRRLSPEEYKKLRTDWDKIDAPFGSRAGYLDLAEDRIREQDRIDGLPVSHTILPSHKFDLDSLKLLAEQSAVDLYSQKRRLARAYPTFKFYFVEEDEQESRLLNFDDFYSYNGVKEFTVIQSCKSPADHAHVTLQNVSGSLDGTKRNAVVDGDYFYSYKKDRADIPENIGTDEEQSFGAIALRPGLNVQLRAGYSNDPDSLEVLISGRVVDIEWNKNGDLTQLFIQSFGTELVQVLKNTATNSSDIEPYYSTHQLLGSLMLEPELMHFGRWEFGKLFQINESKDSRLDFYDYNRDAKGGVFYFTETVGKTMIKYSGLLFFAGVASQLIQFTPAGEGTGAVSKAASKGSKLVRKALAPITKLGRGRKSVQRLYEGLGIAEELFDIDIERRLVKRLNDRFEDFDWWKKVYIHTKNISTVDGKKLDAIQEADIIEKMQEELRVIAQEKLDEFFRIIEYTTEPGKDRLGLDQLARAKHIRALAAIQNARTVEEGRDAVLALQEELFALKFKNLWFSNPAAAAFGTPQRLTDIGGGALRQVTRIAVGTGLLTAGAIQQAALTDLFSQAFLQGTDRGPLDYINNYFTANKVSVLLSPQDDNLFAPHPKDYMVFKSSFPQSVIDKANDIFTSFERKLVDPNTLVGRWFYSKEPFNKKVPVKECTYILKNVYIWDVFREMMLRHPGWVSAVRPYGKEFRYTTFFGIPSQRYWCKGVSNKFVERSNRLVRYLEDGVSTDEYRSLYGNSIVDSSGQQVRTVEEFEASLVDVEDQELLYEIRQSVYGARVLKEYLTGLDYRFVPFRRYHLISSETDLIANNIMSSENAAYNAVDVTYYKADPEDNEPVGSFLFKAHPFIPEHMLRVKPLPPMPNCRGFEMASRYAMGELMQSMREMYRGEIITLGNSRYRPWDVGIILDHHNDIVGPIEIDTVITSMSYEGGYTCEIKPAAFVTANETSSFPILEAIRTAALAVKSLEFSAIGMTDFIDDGAINPLRFIIENGTTGKFEDDYIERKLKAALGDSVVNTGEEIKVVNPLGEDLPDLTNNIIDNSVRTIWGGAKLGSVLASAAGLAVGVPTVSYGTAGAFAYGFLDTQFNLLPDFPSLVNIIGGYSLFLQCLKGDSIQVIPLTKNGKPLLANVSVQDPGVIWKNFKGSLNRVVDDYVDGTRDLLTLWETYYFQIWKSDELLNPAIADFTDSLSLTGNSSENIANAVNLTGDR